MFFVFLFICFVAVWNTKKNSQDKASLLLLDNVEALASDEGAQILRCVGIGDVDCPIDHKKVERYGIGYSLEK